MRLYKNTALTFLYNKHNSRKQLAVEQISMLNPFGYSTCLEQKKKKKERKEQLLRHSVDG